MDEDAWEQLQHTLQDTLANTLHAHDGSMVTRFVVCLDVIDPEGERSLVLQCSPDMKSWDTLGMLEFARQQEQAASVRDSE